MTKVVILGGGFGGVRVALDLDEKLGRRKDVEITLIDKSSEQTFFPSLYEIASVFGVDHQHPFHSKLRGTICIPLSEIFNGTSVNLVEAQISAINLEGKHITTAGANIYPFDYLIIALGSMVSTFGIPGVEEYSYKFKSIEDGLILADKIEELYYQAARGERTLPIRLIIGGAGFTGVELAAELSGCTAHVAHRHGIKQSVCTEISLIEGGPTVLPMIAERERVLIKNRLAKLGVKIMENAPIVEVGPNFVKFKNGQAIEGEAIIWSGGVKALELFKAVEDLELDERGRIVVNGHLQTNNHSYIFATGDAVVFTDPKNQKPVPQLAYTAIEQGKVAAENITRLINNGLTAVLAGYRPVYSTWVAPVGGKYAVAHLGERGWTFSGWLGYLVRELIDFRYFLTVLPFFKAINLFLTDVRVFRKND